MEAAEALQEPVARMQAKAAKLREELRVAQEQQQQQQEQQHQEAHADVRLAMPDRFSEVLKAAGDVPDSVPDTTTRHRLSNSNATSARPGSAAPESHRPSTVARCQQLEAQLMDFKSKYAELLRELAKRQESYIRREDQLRAQLAAATKASGTHNTGVPDSSVPAVGATQPEALGLSAAPAGRGAIPIATTGGLESMRAEVISGVEGLLQRQRLALRADEVVALRQARARLAEVEEALRVERAEREAERGAGGASLTEMREELQRMRTIAEKLDAMHQLAMAEAKRLRIECGAQEDDRQHLIRQMIALKRDKYQLASELRASQRGKDVTAPRNAAPDSNTGEGATASPDPRSPFSTDMATGAQTNNLGPKSTAAAAAAAEGTVKPLPCDCAAAVARLERQLSAEQRQLRALRAVHTAECARRAELQSFLVTALGQLQQQRRAATSATAPGVEATAVTDAEQRLTPATTGSWAAAGAFAQRRPATAVAGKRTNLAHRATARLMTAQDHSMLVATGNKSGSLASQLLPVLGSVADDRPAAGELLAQEAMLWAVLSRCCPDLVADGGQQQGPSISQQDAAELGADEYSGGDSLDNSNSGSGGDRSDSRISDSPPVQSHAVDAAASSGPTRPTSGVAAWPLVPDAPPFNAPAFPARWPLDHRPSQARQTRSAQSARSCERRPATAGGRVEVCPPAASKRPSTAAPAAAAAGLLGPSRASPLQGAKVQSRGPQGGSPAGSGAADASVLSTGGGPNSTRGGGGRLIMRPRVVDVGSSF